MQSEKHNFIPALRFHWATKFYDPLVRWTTKEYPFKRALIAQANLNNNQSILDLACGTGTLSIGIKKRFPNIQIFAVDADEEILQKAKNKAFERTLKIGFGQSFSDKLPFENQKFDRVFSTLSFHHLTHKDKVETINEILRVLKNDGEFHLADYGFPINKSQKVLSNLIRVIDGLETTSDNLKGLLRKLLLENGFTKVEKTGHFNTILGTIRLFRAFK
ncbi:MAG: class I SAM-dependent methyltransferase [Acidobacteriota bacterium]|jgi:ubiquinone/menaquinone biosynthesis C-methylase UbiE|nr:class I SAM-dependent methyltransferase [Acidobacteriota bacterium]